MPRIKGEESEPPSALPIVIRPLGSTMEEAIRQELELHSRIMTLISDPEFWERHRRGLEQIESGDSFTIEEVEAQVQ